MDWFLYGNGLRHERVKGISIPQEDLRDVEEHFFFLLYCLKYIVKKFIEFRRFGFKKRRFYSNSAQSLAHFEHNLFLIQLAFD